MALTFPTPPTPPTPPSAPKVVLEGGGSVTEMPRPKSFGPKSADEINEQKAKDAVAKGSGALSKTTTTKDDSRNTQVEGNINKAQKGENQAARTADAATSAPKAKDAQEKTQDKYIDLKEFQNDANTSQNAAQTAQSPPFRVKDADTSHGALYWGFTVVSVLALLVYAAQKFLIRDKNNKNSFSKSDLSSFAEAVEEPVTATVSTKPRNVLNNYKSQTAEKQKPKEVRRKKETEQKEPGHFEVRV
ncbi:MAG: hypothetical protein J6M62_08410 [Selenomonadaceae bacterium]|nr:hypothetical protein [Selenomonadaceae bacterium]